MNLIKMNPTRWMGRARVKHRNSRKLLPPNSYRQERGVVCSPMHFQVLHYKHILAPLLFLKRYCLLLLACGYREGVRASNSAVLPSPPPPDPLQESAFAVLVRMSHSDGIDLCFPTLHASVVFTSLFGLFIWQLTHWFDILLCALFMQLPVGVWKGFPIMVDWLVRLDFSDSS